MEDMKYFPYDQLRAGQRSLVRHITKSLGEQRSMLAHAPTGLGKTVASLAPAIEVAIEKGLTIFFLTSRHTQHQIALDTLKAIKEKHNLNFTAVSIVGKQHMCLQPGVGQLRSSEFSEYCRHLKEDGRCSYYLNARQQDGSASYKTQNSTSKLKIISPVNTNVILEEGRDNELCPYELGLDMAKGAQVIITDYYYMFSPKIREHFMSKVNKSLDKCILIVDEGHNLPDRIRNLFSDTLTTTTLAIAVKEAEKFGYEELVEPINRLNDILLKLGHGMQFEKVIAKGEFMKAVSAVGEYTDLIEKFESAGEVVLKEQKRSALESIGVFLETWAGPSEGYARILSRKKTHRGDNLQLLYKCLDPSLITKPVIEESYWTLLMSGTLTPPEMYRDLLGFEDKAETQEYNSPFTSRNRLAIVVPKTTTKFTARSEEQYKEMARIIDDVVQKIPGNVAAFFPSYALRDQVYVYLQHSCPRTIFLEAPGMSKQDRADLLERFKSYKDSGAVLLGVAGGSFGEGVDLPGDLLKGVIVVGLPLGRPDMETQELIKYYDEKFGQGWNYGYIQPAFTKTLQNAGRCIRTETDRGVLVFLDSRYAWPRYLKCFPEDWDIGVTEHYGELIHEFFEPR